MNANLISMTMKYKKVTSVTVNIYFKEKIASQEAPLSFYAANQSFKQMTW